MLCTLYYQKYHLSFLSKTSYISCTRNTTIYVQRPYYFIMILLSLLSKTTVSTLKWMVHFNPKYLFITLQSKHTHLITKRPVRLLQFEKYRNGNKKPVQLLKSENLGLFTKGPLGTIFPKKKSGLGRTGS